MRRGAIVDRIVSIAVSSGGAHNTKEQPLRLAPGFNSSVRSPIHGPAPSHAQRVLAGRRFDFSRQVAVMAIVNRTPDSFYDKGRTFALDQAVAAARTAMVDGADLIDIGGVPFARGTGVTMVDEIDRVVPVVEALRDCGTVISVDTFRAEVARRSIAAGAHVINDTSGLRDAEMVKIVADSDASLIITHSLPMPRGGHPRYADVVAEVVDFLRARIAFAIDCGLPAERIIIDPGIDLDKNTLHSLTLIRRFHEIAALGLPVLAAVSNKDFVGETLGDPTRRLEGSLAAAVACVLQGARIVRAHEVAATVAAVRLTEAILGFRPPAFMRHNAG